VRHQPFFNGFLLQNISARLFSNRQSGRAAEGGWMSALPVDTPTTRSVERFRNRTLTFFPAEMMWTLYRRRGSITVVGPFTFLLGPEANRFILANPELFSWREAFRAFIPVSGESALIVSDGAAHRRMRRVMQPLFHRRQIERHLAIIAENADAVIDQWRPGQRIEVFQAFRSALRRSTIGSLFGREMARDTPFISEHIQDSLDLARSGVPQVAVLKRRLCTPQSRRAMAGMRKIDARVYAEIDRLRRDGAGEDNTLLATLVHGTDGSGEPLSDKEIRDQVVNVIQADETTHPVLAWAIYGMLTGQGVWDRAAAEVREVLGDRRPEAADLKRLTYLNGVVHEALRLYSPSGMSLRHVAQDFEFAGRRVKQGSTLIFSPYITHRSPEIWSDPLAFRPQRWDPAEPGYRTRRTDEYLPFIPGPHRCLGAELAKTELTVMLAQLLSRSSLRLTEQRPIRMASLPVMHPAHGIQVDILDCIGCNENSVQSRPRHG
jgi:cytochrome P450